MVRIAAVFAALAFAWGGAAVAQQSTADAAAGAAPAESEAGAPMEEETGIKGVYSLKGMMGLSTGGTEQEDAATGAEEEETEASAAASDGADEAAASN